MTDKATDMEDVVRVVELTPEWERWRQERIAELIRMAGECVERGDVSTCRALAVLVDITARHSGEDR